MNKDLNIRIKTVAVDNKNELQMNVVITGTSKGIGKALVNEFLKEGCKVYSISRGDVIPDFQDNINLVHIKGNISDALFVESLKKTILKVDILIHNAGVLINKPMPQISLQDLNAVYTANVFAPFLVTQALLPVFSKKAHTVFISSVGGVNGTQKFPGLSAYSSSKAAMACLAECLQAEFADTEYSFNALALGAVQTEMLQQAFPNYNASISATQMAGYIKRFALNEGQIVKGKCILVSSTNP